MDDTTQNEYVRGKTQWRVGFAALRGMRRLVDQQEAQQRFEKRAARYVGAAVLALLLLALVALWFSPALLTELLRSLS